eukprot:TRINITY_DN1835_c0_g1_i3.p1 TRINITY_DN1835_c0_g1~~TRINITY_DN1835_c0_g1_i3.p1  ORF type:complete len:195 (+),score=32.85 TRINITY_DN1835_c0_g1_i3:83-667(+)
MSTFGNTNFKTKGQDMHSIFGSKTEGTSRGRDSTAPPTSQPQKEETKTIPQKGSVDRRKTIIGTTTGRDDDSGFHQTLDASLFNPSPVTSGLPSTIKKPTHDQRASNYGFDSYRRTTIGSQKSKEQDRASRHAGMDAALIQSYLSAKENERVVVEQWKTRIASIDKAIQSLFESIKVCLKILEKPFHLIISILL